MSTAAARDQHLDELRALMAAHLPPLHALLVPSEDAHQSEYVSERDKRRQFISGFSGSAGLALITMKEALLWTDGRYFLQATQQLSDRWKLMRMGEDPPVEVWIADNLPDEAVIGIDPWCISVDSAHRYEQAFSKKHQTLFQLSSDLVDEIWKDRPPNKALPVIVHPVEFAGRSVAEKIKELREKLQHEKASGIIITALDEVAWLYNVRGDDVHYSPVVHSYAIVTLHSAFFYVDKRKVTAEVENYMSKNGIDTREYSMVQSDVSLLASGHLKGSNGEKDINKAEDSKIWIDSNSCCLALYSTLSVDQVLMLQSPIALPKAVKPLPREARSSLPGRPPLFAGRTVLVDGRLTLVTPALRTPSPLLLASPVSLTLRRAVMAALESSPLVCVSSFADASRRPRVADPPQVLMPSRFDLDGPLSSSGRRHRGGSRGIPAAAPAPSSIPAAAPAPSSPRSGRAPLGSGRIRQPCLLRDDASRSSRCPGPDLSCRRRQVWIRPPRRIPYLCATRRCLRPQPPPWILTAASRRRLTAASRRRLTAPVSAGSDASDQLRPGTRGIGHLWPSPRGSGHPPEPGAAVGPRRPPRRRVSLGRPSPALVPTPAPAPLRRLGAAALPRPLPRGEKEGGAERDGSVGGTGGEIKKRAGDGREGFFMAASICVLLLFE